MTTQSLLDRLADLSSTSPADVLVVDAGGDDRAVAGELFGTEVQQRGLAALVIAGRTRDTATLLELRMPVWSTGVTPNAYGAKALPETGVSVSLDGVRVGAPARILEGVSLFDVLNDDEHLATLRDGQPSQLSVG